MPLSICTAVSANCPEYGRINPIFRVPCACAEAVTNGVASKLASKIMNFRMASSQKNFQTHVFGRDVWREPTGGLRTGQFAGTPRLGTCGRQFAFAHNSLARNARVP